MYSNCDYCTTNERCGFCQPANMPAAPGFCLPKDEFAGEFSGTTGPCHHNGSAETATTAFYQTAGVDHEWSENYIQIFDANINF
jgi:hypothetical protein